MRYPKTRESICRLWSYISGSCLTDYYVDLVDDLCVSIFMVHLSVGHLAIFGLFFVAEGAAPQRQIRPGIWNAPAILIFLGIIYTFHMRS